MRRTATTLILVATICSTNFGIALSQAAGEKPTGKQSQNTNFLAGLSGIQVWAAKLEAALRSQGSKIDQRKAKDQILPRVVAIQKELSALEDINRRVVEDAGTGPDSLKREKMMADLRALAAEIASIENTFGELRVNVQAISLPEMTDVERLGEGLVLTRALQVYRSLRMLGYGDGNDDDIIQGPKIDYAGLKASNDKITVLLHQAQDAFAKLHIYLES